MEHNEKLALDNECTCEECCQHWDMDEGICLDCGKDRREDLMAAAYDYYKDRMKYGDD